MTHDPSPPPWVMDGLAALTCTHHHLPSVSRILFLVLEGFLGWLHKIPRQGSPESSFGSSLWGWFGAEAPESQREIGKSTHVDGHLISPESYLESPF